MANTQGFEVVLQATRPVIVKALMGAWKSADCTVDPGDEGRIPENKDIYETVPPAPGDEISMGDYVLKDGQIQIPQDELDAHFDTSVNGAELQLGMNVQLELLNPPVPSASLLSFHAILKTRTPIGTIPGSQDVGLLLKDLPRANVSCELDQGHPLEDILDTLIQEMVHQAYEDEEIPHLVQKPGAAYPAFGYQIVCKADTVIFDDEANPARQITANLDTGTNTLTVSIPIYLRLYNITDTIPFVTLQTPMGIETRIILTAAVETPPGIYRVKFSTATASTAPIVAVGTDIAVDPTEAAKYNANNLATNLSNTSPSPMESMLSSMIADQGVEMAQSLGDREFSIPTLEQIEETIGDFFHEELESRDYISLWTPTASNDEFQVDNVTVSVQSNMLNIAINAGGGANVNALTLFVPGSNEFAIAMSQSATLEKINDAIADAGFNSLPKRFVEDGHDVDLNSLSVSLVNHAIRMNGTITVIDAILGSIDVDASFKVDIGLHWTPNGSLNLSGGQLLEHHIIGDTEVDTEEGVAFWIIAIILTIVSFGFGGIIFGIVTIIIILVVKSIAEKIGADLLLDSVSGAIDGITAWPPELSRIGRVRAVFNDPVDISTSGLVIAGTLDVISSCELVQIAKAKTSNNYTVNAAQNLPLNAQKVYYNSQYFWNPGDGSAMQPVRDIVHAYKHSGIYVAKHGLKVLDPGGAASRHFGMVKVKNVAPTVNAGPDIVINEGEEIWLEGTFEDVEYMDTHESLWNFGDDSPLKRGSISETHSAPKGKGITRVKHAWCDQGTYIVTLLVMDNNGGIGYDSKTVVVKNVAPTVFAPALMYAYCCSPITLKAKFRDPGWCDTHTANWHFGDCTVDLMAEVIETNTAPAAQGTATASHVYSRCGSYYAACTVWDDDGASGTGITRVEVVHIDNPKFESGYTYHPAGKVANGWTAFWKMNDPAPGSQIANYSEYTHLTKVGAETGEIYFCEQCLVYDGQRSQRISLSSAYTAGIMQRIGANPDWEYQVACMYQIPPGQSGTAMLGIDPSGSGNPYSAEIKWVKGTEKGKWSNLTVSTVAKGSSISVWLALKAEGRGAEACFDGVEFIAIQKEKCLPCQSPIKMPTCIDFVSPSQERELPPTFIREGAVFETGDQKPHALIPILGSTGSYAIVIRESEKIELKGSVNRCTMDFVIEDQVEVIAIASNATGEVVKRITQRLDKTDKRLDIVAEGIQSIQLVSKQRPALERLCLDPKYVGVSTVDIGQIKANADARVSEVNRIQKLLQDSPNVDAIAMEKKANATEEYVLKIFTINRTQVPTVTTKVPNLTIAVVDSGSDINDCTI